jgi:hypothetical protein
MIMNTLAGGRNLLLALTIFGSAICPALAQSEKIPRTFDWVDTSSPRTTLESLLVGTQRYYDILRREGYTRNDWRELTNIIGQAERLFDLQDIPSGHSHDIAHETAALVREALARVPLPDANDVPDEDEMVKRINEGRSIVYRVQGTPFEIARTESGPYAGRYQFTKDTVKLARSFYEEIKSYPYMPDQDVKGLYEAYFLSPGPLISSAWIRSLSPGMHTVIAEQTMWQWMLLAATVLTFMVVILLIQYLVKRASRNWNRLNVNLLVLIRPVITIFLAIEF